MTKNTVQSFVDYLGVENNFEITGIVKQWYCENSDNADLESYQVYFSILKIIQYFDIVRDTKYTEKFQELYCFV